MSNEAVDTATEVECDVAQGIVAASAFVVPAAVSLLEELPKPVGGPGTMIDGASAWIDASNDLNDAQSNLTSLIGGLSPDQWSGEAHDAFVDKMNQFGQQLNDSYAFAATVSVVLGGLSAPLLAVGPMEDGVAAFIAAEAAFVIAASASTLGLGAAPAEAEANAAAEATMAAAEAFNLALMAIMTGAAAGIEIDAGIDVKLQEDDGSSTIGDDYKKGQIDGAADAALTAYNWAAGKVIDKAAGKYADGVLGEAGPLATDAEKALLKTGKKVLEWDFSKTAEKGLDQAEEWGKEIGEKLADGGDSGGSGESGGGGGGGGGGSWPDDDPSYPGGNPGWPGHNPDLPRDGGGGGGSWGGDSGNGGSSGSGGGGSWGNDPGQNPGWPGYNPDLPRDGGLADSGNGGFVGGAVDPRQPQLISETIQTGNEQHPDQAERIPDSSELNGR